MTGSADRGADRRPNLRSCHLGPKAGASVYRLLGEGSPTKIDYRKSGYPYSILSTWAQHRMGNRSSEKKSGSRVDQ